MRTSKTKSRSSKIPASIDADDLACLGIDPSTLPDLSAPAPSHREAETAHEYLDRIVAEHASRALSDAEAELLAKAMWQRTDGDNIRRARQAFHFVLFMLTYGVKLRDVPEILRPERMTKSGASSTVHRWAHGEYFSSAETLLNALPYSHWKPARREQLQLIVEWELRLRSAAEKRKQDRIFKLAKKEGKTNARHK